MTEYEKTNANRILEEIAISEKAKPMETLKKIYYIYRKMGEIYSYKEEFNLAPEETYSDYIEKINILRAGTNGKGEALCRDINGAIVEILRKQGINAHLVFMEENNPLSHADGCFEVDGRWYFFDLTPDLMRIQTGMKVNKFGISQKQIEYDLKKADPQGIRVYHLYRMNEQNDGKKFSEIPPEKIKQWDDEFKFNYKGIYTDEIFEMIKEECSDKELMKEFFKTDKESEIVNKKFDFFLEHLKVIKANYNKEIGDREAINYYFKLAKSVFTIDEIKNYLEIFNGYTEEAEKRTTQKVVIIKKENENVYYIYDSNTKIYKKISKEELLEKDIKNLKRKEEIDTISKFIEKNEKRFEKKLDEFEK